MRVLLPQRAARFPNTQCALERDLARVEKILDTLDRYEHWNRLYNNWLEPGGQQLSAYAGPNNISDYNKWPAGLIAVRQSFPELADRCTAFLDEIPWEIFYDEGTGRMFYEFDVVDRSMLNPVYFYRGEDKILGHFLAIASGKVPPESWDRHDLSTEERYGYEYFRHGWQGGGLFMQFICGLFLDDCGTKRGHSAANFAWAQMVHGLKIGAPVWGWSACVGPSEQYHGMGDICDEIVTPHASALAIHLFPRDVIANLRRLESYGLRKPYEADGRTHPFGFGDSVNWRTGDIAKAYLVLDQAMLFLALVNYCEDGLVWRTYDRDPMIRHGKRVISEFAEAEARREAEREYIASLSHNDPGTFWLMDSAGPAKEPGDRLRREIWVRSLSRPPLSGFRQSWSVRDADGKAVTQGSLNVDLDPREVRNLHVIDVHTGSARRGDQWTVQGELASIDGRVLQSHHETVLFPSYLPLAGTWKIRADDDLSWSDPRFNDEDWKDISVPSRWEHSVLPDYDGMAWYRVRVSVPADRLEAWADKPLAVLLGRIDDADQTFLNGVRIGAMGRFPPARRRLTSFASMRSITDFFAQTIYLPCASWIGAGSAVSGTAPC